MSELRDYQKKMLESKSKIVFCNWDRGEGKTHSICEKIVIEDASRCLYIGLSDSHFSKQFEWHLRENNYSYISLEDLYIKKESVVFTKRIEGYDIENVIDIKCIGNIGSTRGAIYDYIFFDNVIPDKSVLDNIILPMCKKQVYIMKTIIEGYTFEYIDSNKTSEKLNEVEWIDRTIEDLMTEFSNIVKSEKTTMTREKILGMIENLMKLKRLKIE